MEERKVAESGPRERILRAAIACIERDGLERASVRRIAEEARVNVAAINYYFGSKDELLAEVRDHTLRGALSQTIVDLDALLAQGLPPRRALHKLLDGYVADAIRWPRVTYAHLRDAIVEQDYRSPAARELNRFLEELLERVSPDAAALDATRRRAVLSQIWANVVLVMLMPRLMAPFTGLDLSAAADRRAWVKALLAPLFGE